MGLQRFVGGAVVQAADEQLTNMLWLADKLLNNEKKAEKISIENTCAKNLN